MKEGKIQVLNGNWHYFYRGSMLNLKCGPRDKKPVTREEVEGTKVQLIEDFINRTDARMRFRIQ